MARVEVKGLRAVLRNVDRIVEKQVAELSEELKTTARAKTPIRTGNARRNWQDKKSKTGFTVENKVPYIERLDQGSSKQAPRGIVGPTLTEIKRRNK
jgi:hypothetical protein